MRTPEQRGKSASPTNALNRLSVATDQTARNRSRLRAAEQELASGVIEFQLARQRIGMASADAIEPLTPREQEVVRLVAAGRTDGEIADELFISKKTASVHVANIKGKLAASTRVEIAMIATLTGLGDPGLAPSPSTDDRPGRRPIVVCPFKGLAPFDVADARFFFGREALVAELVARLAGATFLGVVGPSGSGKSSVVRSGLVPALQDGILPGSESWRIAIMRPGESPSRELHRVLNRAVRGSAAPDPDGTEVDDALELLPEGVRLVIVVDQFEETFTVCSDEADRTSFIRTLTDISGDPGARALVVLAVRGDFYGRCAEYRPLAELLGTANALVGPLASDELTRAIELPARAAGLRVEPELTAALVRDVLDQPGGLPLLSTTLLDLWQRRDGRTLRYETYVRIGGVSGAVARLAEAAFGRLTPDEQELARGVLRRLATHGDAHVAVRRRAPIRELDVERNPDVVRVLAVLTAARLITADDGFVEVGHEALLSEWPRMREWLDEDAEGRRIREHLGHAAKEWELSSRDATELYRGARLAAALDWSAGRDAELNTLERQFLAESRAASEREIERERRTNRRLRGLLVGAAALLLVAVAAGAVALAQANVAREQAALAAQRETEARAAARFARSRELAASSVSVLDDDPTLSKLLAVAAADIGPLDMEIETALHQAWLADATIDRYTVPSDTPIEGLVADLHPDGSLVVTTGGPFNLRHGSLSVVDLDSDEELWQYRPEWSAAAVGPAFFSADGTRVVAGVFWEPDEDERGQAPPADALGILVWDAQTGRLVERLDAGPCGTRLLGISTTTAIAAPAPNGPQALPACYAEGFDAALETIDLASGARTPLAARTFGDGTLSRHGRYAAFTDVDTEQFVVMDLATGARVRSIAGDAIDQRDRYVRALSADGSLLLLGDRPIAVIDVATGEVLATLAVGEGESFGAAFGPSGTLAYTSGRDATLRMWDAASGELLLSAPAAGGGRPSAAIDGRILVTDFATNTATVLDPGVRGELGGVETCRGFVPSGTLQVVGEIAAYSSNCGDDRPTYVVDLASQQVVTTAADFEGQQVAMSADGARLARQVAAGDTMSSLQIMDAMTGAVLVEMEDLCHWDLASAEPRIEAGPCKEFPEVPFGLYNVVLEFSPDGRFLAAVDHENSEGYVAVWNAATGELVHAQQGLSAVWGAVFSPDSSELVISTVDGELIAISTESWQIVRRRMVDETVDERGRMGFAGFLADAKTLIGMSGFGSTSGGSLHRIDFSTLTVQSSNRAHDGAPKSLAISPDGTLVASGSADGQVRVWEGSTSTLLHELTVEGQAQGVGFVDNDRLAVTPQAGGVLIMAINPEELLEVVRGSLTRAFTAEECERFNFGSSCPTSNEPPVTAP